VQARSCAVGESGAHQRVLKAIIQRYLEEEPHLTIDGNTDFKVPRFLLNDIVRFWRTMAVDFASKQRDRGGEGWGLRNAKLRMSRKLIFVSGLLTCFSCHLDQELKAKISTSKHGINGERNFLQAYLQEHVLQCTRHTPLDIVARATMSYGVESATAVKLFRAYDEFLGVVGDPGKRERLKALRAENSRTDAAFSEIRNISDRFSEALDEIFFNNQQLGPLTREYGVF
jgi:hypothetical protein